MKPDQVKVCVAQGTIRRKKGSHVHLLGGNLGEDNTQEVDR